MCGISRNSSESARSGNGDLGQRWQQESRLHLSNAVATTVVLVMFLCDDLADEREIQHPGLPGRTAVRCRGGAPQGGKALAERPPCRQSRPIQADGGGAGGPSRALRGSVLSAPADRGGQHFGSRPGKSRTCKMRRLDRRRKADDDQGKHVSVTPCAAVAPGSKTRSVEERLEARHRQSTSRQPVRPDSSAFNRASAPP